MKQRGESIQEEISGLEAQVKTKGQTIGPWIQQEEERLTTMIKKAEEEKNE